ncbi:MAG TPA: carboxypeptidase regulatory-like domain-containing protein [Vicinamibacterales bacterium]|nr:carboxypeptidase regulatory-like domain-containing protein [Vicinamibacterales bacterium]
MSRSSALLSVLLLSGALLASCESKSVPAPPSAGTGKKVDAATAGTIMGHVVLTGTPPPVETIRMNSDPACVQAGGATVKSDAVLVDASGHVANAFVYIKDGLDPSYSFDVPTEAVTLDQKACGYVPHVTGVRVGQPLKILNSDATLHNVHAMPMINQEFNHGQPQGAPPITKTFTAPEVMVRFVCNVHGWMRAYIGVMAHPFWAVTDADGAFKIDGVPPGTYTIGVWHEKFGTLEQKVILGDKQTSDLSFSFAVK